MGTKRRTLEQKQKIVEKVEKNRQTMNVAAACKKAKVKYSTYANYKKELGETATPATVEFIDTKRNIARSKAKNKKTPASVGNGGRVFMCFGTPAEVGELLSRMFER